MYSIQIAVITLYIFLICISAYELSNKNIILLSNKSKIKNTIIIFSVFWYFQALLFGWVLFSDYFLPINSYYASKIILAIPFILSIILIKIKIIELNIKLILYFLVIYLILFLYFRISQFAWDDFAYHIPVELLIRDFGSIWNWADVIYAQWDLIGADIANAMFSIGINDTKFGSINSLIAAVSIVGLISTHQNKYIKYLGLFICLSIPAFILQVGTRYVDIILAWTLLLIFILIYESNNFTFNNMLPVIFLFVSLSFAFSIKYSSIGVILVLLLYLLYKKRFKKLNIAALSFFAFIVGTAHIMIRNIIEKSNALFPYYIFDKDKGYNSILDISNIKENIYKNNLGMVDKPDLYVNIYQYFVSPLIVSYRVLSKTLEGSLSFNDPLISRFLTYDNRIGGVGISIFILIFLGILKYKLRFVAFFCIGFFVFTFFPISIHPRYYLGLYLILIYFLLNAFNKYIFPMRLRIILFTFSFFLVFFSFINIFTFYNNYKISTVSYQQQLKVNNKCFDVIKLGSDIWFGSILWGQNYCGKVVFGKYVYEEEIELNNSKSGIKMASNPILSEKDIEDIYSIIKSKEKKLIVCSSPNKSAFLFNNSILPPCQLVLNFIDKKYNYSINPIFEEQKDGPFLQTIILN